MFNMITVMGIVAVRKVDEQLWRSFKSRLVREKLTLGEGLNLALNSWLSTSAKRKARRSFFDSPAVEFTGDDAERLSERVDEVLYA